MSGWLGGWAVAAVANSSTEVVEMVRIMVMFTWLQLMYPPLARSLHERDVFGMIGSRLAIVSVNLGNTTSDAIEHMAFDVYSV